jgi:DNA repair protein RadA
MFHKYIETGNKTDNSSMEKDKTLISDSSSQNDQEISFLTAKTMKKKGEDSHPKTDSERNDHEDSELENEEQINETFEASKPVRINFEFQTAAKLLEARNQMIRIPTGCKAFDKLIGGGIEPKSVTEFYGAYTTGKTQMSMQLAFNTALPSKLGGLNGDVVYIDSEGSFRPERIIQMAQERDVEPRTILDRILVGRAHNSDVQLKLVDNVLELSEEKNIKLLIVDSLTSAFRAEYIGKGALMDRQQKLNRHMRQLSKIADLLGVAVVITNQVSSVIDGFENTVIPVGGNIIAHGSTHRLHFKKSPKRPQVRIANLVASPSYPNGSATFEICQSGIQDVSFNSLISTGEND